MVALIGSELVVPRPADELTSAIGLDFFRERVVAARFFQQIDGVFNRLTIKQILRDHITRIIIQIADDKDFSWFGMMKYSTSICHNSWGERRSKNRIGVRERLVGDVYRR